jgi:hypothetical protein
MKEEKASGIYGIIVGVVMVLMWTFFIVSGQVPEFESRPVEIVFHLVIEFLTAIMLVISGIAALKQIRWGRLLLLFSFGMLTYTLVLSPGYYAQQGVFAFVIMFAALLALTVYFLIRTLVSLDA